MEFPLDLLSITQKNLKTLEKKFDEPINQIKCIIRNINETIKVDKNAIVDMTTKNVCNVTITETSVNTAILRNYIYTKEAMKRMENIKNNSQEFDEDNNKDKITFLRNQIESVRKLKNSRVKNVMKNISDIQSLRSENSKIMENINTNQMKWQNKNKELICSFKKVQQSICTNNEKLVSIVEKKPIIFSWLENSYSNFDLMVRRLFEMRNKDADLKLTTLSTSYEGCGFEVLPATVNLFDYYKLSILMIPLLDKVRGTAEKMVIRHEDIILEKERINFYSEQLIEKLRMYEVLWSKQEKEIKETIKDLNTQIDEWNQIHKFND